MSRRDDFELSRPSVNSGTAVCMLFAAFIIPSRTGSTYDLKLRSLSLLCMARRAEAVIFWEARTRPARGGER